jgi:hypothetical protein
MQYQDLTLETVIEYIKAKTTIFEDDAKLMVYEIGKREDDDDGFVNHVWDENEKSVI